MKVVEIFVPLRTAHDEAVSRDRIEALTTELADRFGGATSFTRQPADGLWKKGADTERECIVIIEVVVDDLDDEWWSLFRQRLEAEFSQEVVMIRATETRLL